MDLELLDKEGTPFGVYAHEAALRVLHGNLVQMHVHNLAAFKVLVEEGNHSVSALSDDRQEFGLQDFDVRSVPNRLIVLLLLVVFLHLSHTHLLERSHYFF